MTKNKKIMIGIPFHTGMSARFHLSVTNLAYQLTQSGYPVDINYKEGSLLSTQRNDILCDAKNSDYNLLFVDSDMVFSVKDAMFLLNSGKDLIGGLYFGRRPPYMPLVFKEDLTEEKNVFRSLTENKIPDQPFLCKGLGSGFLFISYPTLCDIWEYCKTIHDRPFNFMSLPNGTQYGEDLSFFRRCNMMGLKIWCDPRGDVGHLSPEKPIYRHDHRILAQRDHHYCNDIPGWMTIKEQNWLYTMAKQMDSIVEIGCWKGKTTHALCSGCKGIVTAVDHFKGNKGEKETYHKDWKNSYDEFMKNVGNRFSNLDVIVGQSLSAAKTFSSKNKKVDMVFIDGGHLYKEVMLDLQAWDPIASKFICGHDYTNISNVQQAVNDYFGTDVQIYESIWWVKK